MERLPRRVGRALRGAGDRVSPRRRCGGCADRLDVLAASVERLERELAAVDGRMLAELGRRLEDLNAAAQLRHEHLLSVVASSHVDAVTEARQRHADAVELARSLHQDGAVDAQRRHELLVALLASARPEPTVRDRVLADVDARVRRRAAADTTPPAAGS